MLSIKTSLKKAAIIAASIFALCQTAAFGESVGGVKTVAIYYPHWHAYPHGESWKGVGWTEYDYLRDTKPRFKGHKQPVVPLLGELDDSNPRDVEKEIELAAEYGVDVFLYDWYWYCGVKNMEEALERGFLKAKNNGKIKVCPDVGKPPPHRRLPHRPQQNLYALAFQPPQRKRHAQGNRLLH